MIPGAPPAVFRNRGTANDCNALKDGYSAINTGTANRPAICVSGAGNLQQFSVPLGAGLLRRQELAWSVTATAVTRFVRQGYYDGSAWTWEAWAFHSEPLFTWTTPSFDGAQTIPGGEFFKYGKLGDSLKIRGACTWTVGTALIFTLPGGYRPAVDHILPCYVYASGGASHFAGAITVWASGDVRCSRVLAAGDMIVMDGEISLGMP